ncbi:hypothetical protein WHR41_05215 [Cladosporium halotolerans]|uniref:NFX1-type zinc finger-containing protein 1 n=1 Tax=Cladosporium halotolerans TaxID=1052096 RepID=A0AB34KT99_9PEZI
MTRRKPQHRGGRSGDSRDDSNGAANPPERKKPCFAYARGKCKQGDECKYSHEASVIETHKKNGPFDSTAHTKFVQWRFDIKKDQREIQRAQPLGRRFGEFIQEALRLVNTDQGTMQEVITSLSSDGGLARLGELLNADFTLLTDDALGTVFKDQLLPFLRIISHDDVLSSQVLEGRHATLCNYLYGVNGKRSVNLFRAATRSLTLVDEISADIEPCLIAMSVVVEVNGSAHVNDDLRSAAETLIALNGQRALTGNPLRYLKKMQLRLGLGVQIEFAEDKPKDRQKLKPTSHFEVPVDQPGSLSIRGPRHDNDFENIADIQILPTIDEIMGDRAEYLPRSEPSSWHLQGVAGLLDRQFRLVREDTVGQLRDAAKFELSRMQSSGLRPVATKPSAARTHVYHNVRLVDAVFEDRRGLLCVLEFDQPRQLHHISNVKDRRHWWEDSKRLGAEALITLLGPEGFAVFMTVANETLQPMQGGKGKSKIERPIEDRYSRFANPHVAHVVVQLVSHTEEDIDNLLFRLGLGIGQSGVKRSFSLLEFPGVLLPTFQHTLTALQQMSESLDLPFSEVLAPTDGISDSAGIDKPAYTKKNDFRFNMSALSTDNQAFELDVNAPDDAATISAKTRLDVAQAEAVISTLSRSMSLIQGPPGTGKSYTGVALMEVLLANNAKAKLGPVLCVTFTNHALDQILEHLLDAGLSQIIRIGSRSKSEVLAPLNLRLVAQKHDMTKLEQRERFTHKDNIAANASTIKSTLDRWRHAFSHQSIFAFLEQKHPSVARQLSGPKIDDDGFETVESRQKGKGLKAWLSGDSHQPVRVHEDDETDIFSLRNAARQRLYTDWKEEIANPVQRELIASIRGFEEAKAGLDRVRSEVDLHVLSAANVIGVTTSGLARNINLLRRLNSKVLLVEEAGEVLEAHLLTAMLPSIEHAILIGDHQQLRPKAQNYELSCENPRSQTKMDVSLFERLVAPQEHGAHPLPFVTLETQRRMHPSISELIRSTLYPNLKDDPSVSDYPQVSGMRQRLFWLDHDNPEDGEAEQTESTSHTNQFEVDMVFSLVRHLVRQGVYRASDIAVLTPYLGQLRKLRRALGDFAEVIINDRDIDQLALEGEDETEEERELRAAAEKSAPPRLEVTRSNLLQALRLATVDNFQGEEAKVVIISLVRCNQEHKCGFLKTSNRINVLLSRAQHGMYIIGNTETSAHVPMWGDVMDILKRDGNLGKSFELCCPRHPDTPLKVTLPDDFATVSPEAGCDLLCGQRLPCGHACINKCHSEGLHKAVYCTKPCNRAKDGCEHNCPYECGRQCDALYGVEISNIDVELVCGHHADRLPCWQYQDPTKVQCQVLVDRTVPGCGHKVAVACHIDIASPLFKCPADCGSLRACGHSYEVKSIRADLLMMSTYGEVDLEESPCVFLPCGHIFTLESIDGAMRMRDHYTLDENGMPSEIKGNSEPFSSKEMKNCPDCRASLRLVSRYGRIVRRALLDESTKKFIVWSSAAYRGYAENMKGIQERLLESKGTFTLPPGTVELRSTSHVRHIQKLHGLNKRYRELAFLRTRLASFAQKTEAEEQPYRRVHDIVETARRRRLQECQPKMEAFNFDQTIIQTRSSLLAAALTIRCELVAVADFISVFQEQSKPGVRSLQVDFEQDRDRCDELIHAAKTATSILQETEGHISWAHFAALERGVMESVSYAADAKLEGAKLLADAHLDTADELCKKYPGQTASIRMVVAAMAGELRETGHWYTCANGHPFAVGECGMPMEEARCPACNAPIGGRSHEPAAGVQRAEEIEREFGNLMV